MSAALALLSAADAQAVANAPLPDAGQILQEIEKGIEAKPQERLPKPIVEEAPVSEDDQVKLVVKEFKFVGNKVVSSGELLNLLSPLLHHEITLTQLKASVDLIAKFYQERGYLAVATLPEQDVTDGIVTIDIVEAKFGGVKVNGVYNQDYRRINPTILEKIVAAHTQKGEVLDQAGVDHSLTVINRLPGIMVDANYQPGSQDGTTDLHLSVKDKSLVSTYFMADNTGGRSTGKEKQFASITLNSPLGYGDSLAFSGLRSDGTIYGQFVYSVPVGTSGLRVGLNQSYMQYEVTLKDPAMQSLSTYKPKGFSRVSGLDLTYPVILAKKGSLELVLNYDDKDFVNQRLEGGAYVDSANYNVRVYSAALNGRLNDDWLAGAINTFNLDLAHGHVDKDGDSERNRNNDAISENTLGYYNRIRWDLARTQFFSDSLSLSVKLSGQFADKNLDSSEKMYLGGSTGVRAYPTSEAGGSQGFMSNIELTKYLPYNFVASVFRDDGRIQQYKYAERADGTATLMNTGVPNSYWLRGYGASLAWNGPYSSQLKVTYATRVGGNPNPYPETTNDSDGSHRENVFWFSGSVAY